MANIHQNLEAIQDVASHYAEKHGVRYTVILAPGGTYEFVVDSYFQKERPGVQKITEHMPDGSVTTVSK